MASPYGLHKLNRAELDELASALTLEHPATVSKAELKETIEEFLRNRHKEIQFKRMNVTMLRGRRQEFFSLKLRMGTTIAGLKVMIQSREGVPAADQNVTIDGVWYDDASTLAACSADEKSIVCTVREAPFPIGVTLMSGRRIVANVRPYTTNFELKVQIETITDIPRGRQRLIFGEEDMYDGTPMYEQHVRDGSELSVVILAEG